VVVKNEEQGYWRFGIGVLLGLRYVLMHEFSSFFREIHAYNIMYNCDTVRFFAREIHA